MRQTDNFTNLQKTADALLRKATPPTDLLSFLEDVRDRNLQLQRAARELYELTGLEIAFSSIKNWTERLLEQEVAS